jgi:hypothetical protein
MRSANMLGMLNISLAVSRAGFLVAGTGNQSNNKSNHYDNSKLFHTRYNFNSFTKINFSS